MKSKENDLRIWWVQLGCSELFLKKVKSMDEATLLLDVLAGYDLYLETNNYLTLEANLGGLEIFKDGVWIDWENEDGYSITEIEDELKD